jgi:Fur family peroxide stress response transcriptional regulator
MICFEMKGEIDMMKNSRQRNSIKIFLMHRTDHPTASTIYQELRKEYPKISLGTVYRNLNLMCSLGEIRRISCGEESDRFDGVATPHYHHVCTLCGAVHDIPMQPICSINELAQNFTEHEIFLHQTYFYGICKDCKNKDEI